MKKAKPSISNVEQKTGRLRLAQHAVHVPAGSDGSIKDSVIVPGGNLTLLSDAERFRLQLRNYQLSGSMSSQDLPYFKTPDEPFTMLEASRKKHNDEAEKLSPPRFFVDAIGEMLIREVVVSLLPGVSNEEMLDIRRSLFNVEVALAKNVPAKLTDEETVEMVKLFGDAVYEQLVERIKYGKNSELSVADQKLMDQFHVELGRRIRTRLNVNKEPEGSDIDLASVKSRFPDSVEFTSLSNALPDGGHLYAGRFLPVGERKSEVDPGITARLADLQRQYPDWETKGFPSDAPLQFHHTPSNVQVFAHRLAQLDHSILPALTEIQAKSLTELSRHIKEGVPPFMVGEEKEGEFMPESTQELGNLGCTEYLHMYDNHPTGRYTQQDGAEDDDVIRAVEVNSLEEILNGGGDKGTVLYSAENEIASFESFDTTEEDQLKADERTNRIIADAEGPTPGKGLVDLSNLKGQPIIVVGGESVAQQVHRVAKERFGDIEMPTEWEPRGPLTEEEKEQLQNLDVSELYPKGPSAEELSADVKGHVVDLDVQHMYLNRLEPAEAYAPPKVALTGGGNAMKRGMVLAALQVAMATGGIRGADRRERRRAAGTESKADRKRFAHQISIEFDENHPGYQGEYVAQMRDVLADLGILIAMERKNGNKRINTYIRTYCVNKAKKLEGNPLAPMLKEIAKHRLCEVEVTKVQHALDVIDRLAKEKKDEAIGSVQSPDKEAE